MTFISEKTKKLIGSWFRIFVAAVIAAVLQAGTAPWQWANEELLNFLWAGVGATLVAIYNYVNPDDDRFGVVKDK